MLLIVFNVISTKLIIIILKIHKYGLMTVGYASDDCHQRGFFTLFTVSLRLSTKSTAQVRNWSTLAGPQPLSTSRRSSASSTPSHHLHLLARYSGLYTVNFTVHYVCYIHCISELTFCTRFSVPGNEYLQ